MKKLKMTGWAITVGALLMNSGARAADPKSTSPADGSPSASSPATDAPQVVPVQSSGDSKSPRDHQVSPGIGGVLHRTDKNLPDDVKALIQKFESERDAFLKQQDDLRKQLKAADNDKRDELREQLRANKDQWNEEAKQWRDDIRQRLKDLKDKLPSHSEVIDSAKEDAKQHRGK